MFDHAKPVNIVIQTLRFLEKVRNHIYLVDGKCIQIVIIYYLASYISSDT